jgi:hypothetical protein
VGSAHPTVFNSQFSILNSLLGATHAEETSA